jgi:hypothetical protein
MFELISHCYKNCLGRCDDFCLNFLSKSDNTVPSSFPQLSISPCCRYNQIPPQTPFSPALRIWIVCPKFQVSPPWDHGFVNWQFLFWAVNWPKFLYRVFIWGQILNSCPDSCVCWLLSLKCQACPMDSKQFLLIVCGKMGVKIIGSVTQ